MSIKYYLQRKPTTCLMCVTAGLVGMPVGHYRAWAKRKRKDPYSIRTAYAYLQAMGCRLRYDVRRFSSAIRKVSQTGGRKPLHNLPKQRALILIDLIGDQDGHAILWDGFNFWNPDGGLMLKPSDWQWYGDVFYAYTLQYIPPKYR